MVYNLQKTFENILYESSWMDNTTKTTAIGKVSNFFDFLQN